MGLAREPKQKRSSGDAPVVQQHFQLVWTFGGGDYDFVKATICALKKLL